MSCASTTYVVVFPWRYFPRGTSFRVSWSLRWLHICFHKRWVEVCFCMYTIFFCSVCRPCGPEQSQLMMMMMNCSEIEVTSRRCKVLGSAVVQSEAGLFSAMQHEGFSFSHSCKKRGEDTLLNLGIGAPSGGYRRNVTVKCYCKVFLSAVMAECSALIFQEWFWTLDRKSYSVKLKSRGWNLLYWDSCLSHCGEQPLFRALLTHLHSKEPLAAVHPPVIFFLFVYLFHLPFAHMNLGNRNFILQFSSYCCY